eukprot:TRINITY_DN906_c0_g1_i2.p1 TRINITY_DN906_c0_g1~~TRINITY_DN906_c0_g1_i2.p1  ORF type:complete len:498 (+),score=146.84 TRINITY_DN906_c0_g1_i2:33-1526(+)
MEILDPNIGIVAIDIYFPHTCVDQTDLEIYDNCVGKYTIGLEQKKMSFCSDREDVVSMGLTVVNSLMEKYSIDYKDIGRLEVGSESNHDKSKSIKSCLMQLFDENNDVVGADCINACYGGTAALLNSVNWLKAKYYSKEISKLNKKLKNNNVENIDNDEDDEDDDDDGYKYALVVVSDIAVYESGTARATGGCGALAILLGVDAPIVIDDNSIGSYMSNDWDFYKPNNSPFPVVDGRYSVTCYTDALSNCQSKFTNKLKKQTKNNSLSLFQHFDYFIYHSPYSKLVKKSFARMYYNEFLSLYDNENVTLTQEQKNNYSKISQAILNEQNNNSNNNKDSVEQFTRLLEKTIIKLIENDFNEKVESSTRLCKQIGNIYTGSLYLSLLSLIYFENDDNLIGKKLLAFSYGSGVCSSLFYFRIRKSVQLIKNKLENLESKLNQRNTVTVNTFLQTLTSYESTLSQPDYTPITPTTDDYISSGTFYLNQIDSMYQRTYTLKQ